MEIEYSSQDPVAANTTSPMGKTLDHQSEDNQSSQISNNDDYDDKLEQAGEEEEDIEYENLEPEITKVKTSGCSLRNFPLLRLWRKLMIDKKQAFKFKYDTHALNMVENNQGPISYLLYINTVLFYLACILVPIQNANECGKGIKTASHAIYGFYATINLITELYLVLRLEREVHNSDLLKFNSWHFMELIMG